MEQAIDAKGAVDIGGGTRRWRLASGEIEVSRLEEGGKTVGLELKVPLSERTELVSQTLRAGMEVATQCAVRLVDPQLGRSVSEKDDGIVSEQFLRTATYAGEMMGLPEAVGASFTEPAPGLKPGTKVALGLVVLVIVLYFVVDALSRFF